MSLSEWQLSKAAVFRCVCVCVWASWSSKSKGGVKVATMVAIVLCAGVVSWATMVALHWWLVGTQCSGYLVGTTHLLQDSQLLKYGDVTDSDRKGRQVTN